MNKPESENFKIFKSFMRISCLCGIGKFQSHRHPLVEGFSRVYSLTLATIFAWISISNHVNNFYTHYDGLTSVARGIDRSELILMAAVLCFEASIRKKRDSKVISSIDRLDDVLSKRFDVKINYKLMKTYNLLLTLIIVAPPTLVARQFFISKIDTFYSVVFTFFIFAQLIVAVVKSTYLSFIVAFLLRFKALNRLLIGRKARKFKVESIFIDLSLELSRLFEIFNESFGFTALMIIGKIKI